MFFMYSPTYHRVEVDRPFCGNRHVTGMMALNPPSTDAAHFQKLWHSEPPEAYKYKLAEGGSRALPARPCKVCERIAGQ